MLGHQLPAHVRRAVRERDGGQCTFVSEAGRRCPARRMLEFDHLQEVARGGEASVEGIRLRCRAHNQYGAERTFGSEFMLRKRQETRRVATEARATGAAARVQAPEPHIAPERDVTPWLRALGFRADEARRGAAACAVIPDASLEDRIRLALSSLAPRGLRRAIPGNRVEALASLSTAG